MRKDKFQNQNCASVFLTNNASLHFANATPDYQARGDIKARAFQIIYRGQQCCAEVRASQKGRARYCVCAAHGLRRHSCGGILRPCLGLERLDPLDSGPCTTPVSDVVAVYCCPVARTIYVLNHVLSPVLCSTVQTAKLGMYCAMHCAISKAAALA